MHMLVDYLNPSPIRFRSISRSLPTSEKIRILVHIRVLSTPHRIRQRKADYDMEKALSAPIRSIFIMSPQKLKVWFGWAIWPVIVSQRKLIPLLPVWLRLPVTDHDVNGYGQVQYRCHSSSRAIWPPHAVARKIPTRDTKQKTLALVSMLRHASNGEDFFCTVSSLT